MHSLAQESSGGFRAQAFVSVVPVAIEMTQPLQRFHFRSQAGVDAEDFLLNQVDKYSLQEQLRCGSLHKQGDAWNKARNNMACALRVFVWPRACKKMVSKLTRGRGSVSAIHTHHRMQWHRSAMHAFAISAGDFALPFLLLLPSTASLQRYSKSRYKRNDTSAQC